jgi:hypothetical protein
METPKSTHWKAGKMIMRYVTGTTNYGAMYTSYSYFKLVGYADSDFDRKSTSGYVFTFGSRVVAWVSNKNSIVTLLSVEAEYVAATTTRYQTLWMRRIMTELLHE